MEFRLTYDGQLLGASRRATRAEHKHEIRKVFHAQLKRLWAITPFLCGDIVGPDVLIADNIGVDLPHTVEDLSARFARFDYRFVPLVTRNISLLCGIELLFLRPDPPGSVLSSGDIDNRLKTLFDALRIPHDASEVGRYKTPEAEEDPFFCLLEDDSLITK